MPLNANILTYYVRKDWNHWYVVFINVEGRKGNSNRNKCKVYRRTKIIKIRLEIHKTGSTINRSQTLSLWIEKNYSFGNPLTQEQTLINIKKDNQREI